MAISGGLYLLGIKGNVTEIPVSLVPGVSLDLAASDLEAAVRQLLTEAGIEHRFEYLKREDGALITRPTSRVYYIVHGGEDGVRVTRNEPDLQKRLIELHKRARADGFQDAAKGHGYGVARRHQHGILARLVRRRAARPHGHHQCRRPPAFHRSRVCHMSVNGTERCPVFGKIRCPIFCTDCVRSPSRGSLVRQLRRASTVTDPWRYRSLGAASRFGGVRCCCDRETRHGDGLLRQKRANHPVNGLRRQSRREFPRG